MHKPGALSALLSTSEVSGRRPPLALLVLVTAIAPAALHMLVPSLPILATVFDAPAANVQLVLTLFLAGIATGQLVYGPVSDRLGRRPVLIAGLLLFLVGTALCGLAWSLPVLIVGRVLHPMARHCSRERCQLEVQIRMSGGDHLMVDRLVRGAQMTGEAIFGAAHGIAQVAHSGRDGTFVRPALGGVRSQPV